jgi:hypothetical protein
LLSKSPGGVGGRGIGCASVGGSVLVLRVVTQGFLLLDDLGDSILDDGGGVSAKNEHLDSHEVGLARALGVARVGYLVCGAGSRITVIPGALPLGGVLNAGLARD